MPESETIDRTALNNLLTTVGGDLAFLGELMDTYFDDTPRLLATIRQAVESGKPEELRRAAHSLKSNSANFGAMTLSRLCKELEEIGKSGAVARAGERLPGIEAEYERVRVALEAIRASDL
ncbi:MAG TPA: Hpt domain-containing protein [Anaerolineales bacterium]|nr:Hpt domain-containing protein [Anaerolineales bacterium]